MTIIRKVLIAATLGSLAFGASVLSAQTEEEKPEITAPVSKDSNLSSNEMKKTTKEHVAAMQDILVRVVELQKLARKQKDVIKLNCVNDKLLQVKQLLNIAESSRTDLIESIAQQDDGSAKHEFSQISIAREKTDGLRNEAEGCIGEELVFLGPTEVSVEDPGLQDDPTENADFNWIDVIDPPAYASPFL